MAVEGTVYLLHFERPFHGPMRHYVGFTAGNLDKRLQNHRDGTGSVTTRRAFERGITFILARTTTSEIYRYKAYTTVRAISAGITDA